VLYPPLGFVATSIALFANTDFRRAWALCSGTMGRRSTGGRLVVLAACGLASASAAVTSYDCTWPPWVPQLDFKNAVATQEPKLGSVGGKLLYQPIMTFEGQQYDLQITLTDQASGTYAAEDLDLNGIAEQSAYYGQLNFDYSVKRTGFRMALLESGTSHLATSVAYTVTFVDIDKGNSSPQKSVAEVLCIPDSQIESFELSDPTSLDFGLVYAGLKPYEDYCHVGEWFFTGLGSSSGDNNTPNPGTQNKPGLKSNQVRARMQWQTGSCSGEPGACRASRVPPCSLSLARAVGVRVCAAASVGSCVRLCLSIPSLAAPATGRRERVRTRARHARAHCIISGTVTLSGACAALHWPHKPFRVMPTRLCPPSRRLHLPPSSLPPRHTLPLTLTPTPYLRPTGDLGSACDVEASSSQQD
jgi:hypothetical protein